MVARCDCCCWNSLRTKQKYSTSSSRAECKFSERRLPRIDRQTDYLWGDQLYWHFRRGCTQVRQELKSPRTSTLSCWHIACWVRILVSARSITDPSYVIGVVLPQMSWHQLKTLLPLMIEAAAEHSRIRPASLSHPILMTRSASTLEYLDHILTLQHSWRTSPCRKWLKCLIWKHETKWPMNTSEA